MIVVPDDRPATKPVASTVAVDGIVLVHAPPIEASVNAVFDPAQTVGVPVIAPAFGSALTVTTCVAAAVPQLLVIV